MTKKVNSDKKSYKFPESIIGKLSIISIALTGIGIIINNIYLLEFDIVDFNLLQPRNIFTGITFFIYLSIYFVVFLFKLDITDLRKHSYFKIVFHLVVKYFVIVSGIFFLLIVNKQLIENEPCKILYSFSIGVPMMFLILYGSDAIFTEKERTSLVHRISFPLFEWLLTLTAIGTFFYSFYYISEFNHFAWSQSFILFFAIGIFFASKNVQIKIELSKSDTKKFEPTKSLFTENQSNYNNLAENFFFLLLGGLLIIISVYKYSIHIHDNIPTNYGGAKKHEISLLLSNGKQIKGSLIFQNENKYYIQNENELLFIKKDDVTKTFLKTE